MIFTKAQFEQVRAAVQQSVMDTVFDTSGLVAKIMVAPAPAPAPAPAADIDLDI